MIRDTKIIILTRIRIAISLFFSTIFIVSCLKISPEDASTLEIKSGQSFGECIGACYQEMTVFSQTGEIDFVIKESRFMGSIEDKLYKEQLSESELSDLIDQIEFENFKKFNEVYGCPDCADGGSEWIEITRKGISHKVTFEYGKEVKELENLILLLRKYRVALSEKFLANN